MQGSNPRPQRFARPHRYAKTLRARRSDAGAVRLGQTSLQVRAPETGLELLFAEARPAFGTACLIVFQCDGQPRCSRGYASSLVFKDALSEITRRTDVQIPVTAPQHVGVKH